MLITLLYTITLCSSVLTAGGHNRLSVCSPLDHDLLRSMRRFFCVCVALLWPIREFAYCGFFSVEKEAPSFRFVYGKLPNCTFGLCNQGVSRKTHTHNISNLHVSLTDVYCVSILCFPVMYIEPLIQCSMLQVHELTTVIDLYHREYGTQKVCTVQICNKSISELIFALHGARNGGAECRSPTISGNKSGVNGVHTLHLWLNEAAAATMTVMADGN